MKVTAFAAFFLCAVSLLCFSASAASYTDEMDGLNSDTVKQYSNLKRHSFGSGASVVPDATAAGFSGDRLSAYAQYRAEGATSVTAAIYSNSGIFVSRDPESPETYMLGAFRENMDFIAGKNPPQALYCEATNGVYTYEGGLKQMYMNMNNTYEFGGVITPPTGSVIGYGVNIYYSFDGQQFAGAPARMSSMNFDSANGYCYERYTAAVPGTAKYIRVEINDVSSVPLAGGGSRDKNKMARTALASVTITGDKLVLGEPEPGIAVMLPGGAQDAEKRDSSAERGALTEAERIAAAKAALGKWEASSKFEGTITSSSQSGRASSSKQERKSGGEVSASSGSETEEQSEIAPEETIVHNIRRASEKTGFNSGITAYIIIVSGAIVLLAVLQKRK